MPIYANNGLKHICVRLPATVIIYQLYCIVCAFKYNDIVFIIYIDINDID